MQPGLNLISSAENSFTGNCRWTNDAVKEDSYSSSLLFLSQFDSGKSLSDTKVENSEVLGGHNKDPLFSQIEIGLSKENSSQNFLSEVENQMGETEARHSVKRAVIAGYKQNHYLLSESKNELGEKPELISTEASSEIDGDPGPENINKSLAESNVAKDFKSTVSQENTSRATATNKLNATTQYNIDVDGRSEVENQMGKAVAGDSGRLAVIDGYKQKLNVLSGDKNRLGKNPELISTEANSEIDGDGEVEQKTSATEQNRQGNPINSKPLFRSDQKIQMSTKLGESKPFMIQKASSEGGGSSVSGNSNIHSTDKLTSQESISPLFYESSSTKSSESAALPKEMTKKTMVNELFYSQNDSIDTDIETEQLETKTNYQVRRAQTNENLNSRFVMRPEQKIQMIVKPEGVGKMDIEVSMTKGEMNARIISESTLSGSELQRHGSNLANSIMGNSNGINNLSLMFHDGRSSYLFKRQKNPAIFEKAADMSVHISSDELKKTTIHNISIIA